MSGRIVVYGHDNRDEGDHMKQYPHTVSYAGVDSALTPDIVSFVEQHCSGYGHGLEINTVGDGKRNTISITIMVYDQSSATHLWGGLYEKFRLKNVSSRKVVSGDPLRVSVT